MDINRRKTGLGRLIEIAGTKRWLLIGAMSLAVITAIVQFVPIIAVYNILIELAKHAIEPSMIDKAYIWQWGYIALGAFLAFGVLTFVSLMLSHIAAFNILYEIRMQLAQKMVHLPLGFFNRRASAGQRSLCRSSCLPKRRYQAGILRGHLQTPRKHSMRQRKNRGYLPAKR